MDSNMHEYHIKRFDSESMHPQCKVNGEFNEMTIDNTIRGLALGVVRYWRIIGGVEVKRRLRSSRGREQVETEPRGENEPSPQPKTNHSKSGLRLPSIVALVIIIDRSWTCLGRHEKAFYTGLKKFVEHCKLLVNSSGNVKCPCKSCRLVSWVSIKNLSDHITNYGWEPSYKTWIHHGESNLPSPVIDNTRQPQTSDMTACLNDLSYIPPNNEQNEPTQGDIGETSNEPSQAKCNEFEELYASANEELYPGCDYVTRLDFMAKFTYFKVKGKLTDSIFNEILEFFQNIFPTSKGYKLPPSYYAIKKTFKTIRLGYESIHACVNDCFLFRGEDNKDVHFCPVCNTSGWKDSNTPRKKVPKKVLRYFLTIPRLQRLYKSSHTTKEMTWHATGKYTEPGKMKHPIDGRAWKNFDTKYPDFTKEPRNVRLGLAADGFNPFGNLSQSYSMWPVILTTYNLPPWLCMKESSFMLTLLIPGPKSPGKDIDVYLRPLIDDLKDLWALKGVETIDVATGQKFNMRVMVLWTINYFFARSSLSGWSGQGYKACPTCNEDTPSMRQYLPPAVATPITELCSFFNQVCSQTLMEDDMLKAQSKVVDILCNLELIYPPAFFDIMSHLVIHLPLEALEGGPIRPWWKYPFERFIKKLKNYVRNKAKSEGSIAEGYVAEEALTFSSHYFWDVTIKFNRPDRNVDCPPPTCQFHVFRSVCKLIGLRSVIRFDHQELKKVIWYVLHNSPEIDTYWAKFKRHERRIPRLVWVADPSTSHRQNPGVSASSELFTLACRPTHTPISVNSCVVNGVRFVVHNRDERRTTQNCGICSPGDKDREMYYGQLEEFLEFSYMSFKVVLFRVKWFDTSNEGRKVKRFVIRNNMTQIWANEDDHDVIHFENSDLALSTSLNDLDFATLHIDGQSMDVDAPSDIMDVDEDDDIIDEEDALPHGLADSDDEDLVNVDDDDDVAVVYSSEEEMSADVARGHDGDGGGDDRPPPYQIGGGCRGKGTRKHNLGGRKANRLNTRTLMPLGDHAAHWANLLREIVREFPMHYRSWHNIPAEKKAGVLGKIGQHLEKIYTDNKSALKAEHWVPNPEDGTYDVEHIRSRRPANTSQADWDAKIAFWSDPKNAARCAQNKLTGQRARSYADKDPNHLPPSEICSSETREYPSLIQTYFQTHTVDGVFLREEDRLLYEMLRLHGLGSNTPTGVPYTDDEIMAIVRRGKNRGHILGVGRVLARQGMYVLILPESRCTHTADVDDLKKINKQLKKQMDMIMKVFRSDDKMSQLLTQIQSHPEVGIGSGSGGAGDDESGDDEDDDEDEEDEDS
ncbi:reverse transcriptase domain-containing protein [Tanacetum coccineum]